MRDDTATALHPCPLLMMIAHFALLMMNQAKRAMPMRVDRWIIHGHPPWHCKKAEKNEWLELFDQVGRGRYNPQHVGILNSVQSTRSKFDYVDKGIPK
jgi:hypothetical protein